MTSPITTSRIGQRGTQPGLFELGAAVGPLNPAPVTGTIPTSAKPYIAHVYNNALTSFTLSFTTLNRPKLKWSLNGGYDSVTLLTATDLTVAPPLGGPVVSLGSVIQLTEQDGDGAIVYSGIVEQTINTYDNPAQFGLVLTPLVAELGDTGFSTNYVNATDIAQMVRDAVNSTIHLKFNNYTIPDTGQTAVYNFATTNCLDVLNIARLMAGTNYWWFVDAKGYVWFQPMGGLAEYTFSQMQQYASRTKTPDITKQKNNFTVIGGIPNGSTAAITASYLGSSTATVGSRTIMPPPTFPTVTNQTVLNNLAATIGGVLDRTINRIDMTALNTTTPVVPNQPGGPMIRYWEPVNYPTQQASTGSGGYSPNYIVLENDRDGPIQTLKLGDIPVNNVDDLKYMLDNIVRYWTVNASSVNPSVVQGGTMQNVTIQTAHSPAVTLADSTGILSAALITVLGNNSDGNPGPYVGPGPLLIPGTVVTFSLARAQTIFWAFSVVGKTSGATGQFAAVQLFTDGVSTNTLGNAFDKNNTGVVPANFSFFTLNPLSAGNHTMDLRINPDSGQTWTNTDSVLAVYAMGS